MLSLMRKIQPNKAISPLVGQKRTEIMATLPRGKLSTLEAVGHGLFFFVGVLAVPTYIAFNIKHYRGGSK